MSLIPLVGLADNDPVPGNYLAVNFSQGQASSGQTNYAAILIGNSLGSAPSGDNDGYVYGPDTSVQLVTEQDCIDIHGSGSELHRMWLRFTAVNKSTSLYTVVVKESTGNAAAATFTVSGTATSNGTILCYIEDVVVESGFATDDTATDIATELAAQINNVTRLPLTAGHSGGGVTLTAKQKGLRGNKIKFSVQVTPLSGSGITTTNTGSSYLSGGTVDDDNSVALTAIANTRYYYQVSAADDATQVGDLVDQIDAQAAPVVGNRCRAVVGSVDSLATAISSAIAVNQARAEIEWQPDSDWTPAELAANGAAVYSLFETALGAQSSLNFDSFGGDAGTSPFWLVPAPRSGSTVSRTEIKSALLNGLTPISAVKGGKTILVKRITTRSLSGATQDYRIRDAHKVTVADVLADDLLARAASQFAGKVIGNDPVQGQRVPGATVVTPRVFKAMVNKLLNDYANRDLLQNLDQILAGVQVVRETSPSTRISARIPLQVVDILDQTATNLDEVGSV